MHIFNTLDYSFLEQEELIGYDPLTFSNEKTNSQ